MRDLSARRDFFSAEPQNFDAWRPKPRQALKSFTRRFAPASPVREIFFKSHLPKIDTLKLCARARERVAVSVCLS
jgi:hypothetical protein